jgi:hypothetical protein
MGEESEQQVLPDEEWRRFDWKRRAAAGLLGESAARRVARPGTLAQAWLKDTVTSAGRANRAYTRRFKNTHVGERCVIIGNGPSLRNTDLGLLRGEYTFGLNRIYLMFDELGFDTSFHVVTNRLVVEQFADDFRKIRAPLFTMMGNRQLLDGASGTGFLRNIVGPWFSRDPSRGVWQGHTVTYVAMQLAHYMGFREVILVGVDHRFAVGGTPNQVVESAGPDASHFDPRYFAKGVKWQLPDLANSEVSYELARASFEADGRRIIDATVDGALTVFPKTTLEEALRR